MTPTILIFLKAPVPGQAKTRLAAGVGDDAAMEIYQKLVHHQMAALPEDWPVEVHFAPAEEEPLMRAWVGESSNRAFFPQVDGGLGARLVHATKAAFERGAEGVVLLGGDCPEVNATILTRAAEMISARTVVLGPAFDGGYYLLGVGAPHVALLAHDEWGGSTVAATTRRLAKGQGLAVRELPRLRDVDTMEDWRAVAHLFD